MKTHFVKTQSKKSNPAYCIEHLFKYGFYLINDWS